MAGSLVHRAVAVAFTGVALAVPAAADPAYDAFGLERFHLSLDRDGVLDVDSGRVGNGWTASAWMTAVDDPLVLTRLSDGSTVGALVAKRVGLELGATVALWGRLQLGVSAPLVMYQSSNVTAAQMPVGARPLPSAGLGDVRFVPKLGILDGAVQLAGMLVVTAPPGSAHGFLRESGPTAAPELAASTRLGGVRVAADVGYRLRSAVQIANQTVDDEAFARVGASVAIAGRSFAPSTELAFSLAAATPAKRGSFARSSESAVTMLVGARHAFGLWRVVVAGGVGLGSGVGNPDWRALAAVEWVNQRADSDHDGLADEVDRCPNEPEDRDGYQDADGCPDLDDDGDGVPDTVDRAPREPEDKDGFQDGDGVPDPDNDRDGVADGVDRCPIRPETRNGYQDADGCPDELGAALAIRITSPRGAPVRHAHVKLTWPGGASELETGDDGTVAPAAFDGPREVAIVVTARGFKDGRQTAHVERALAATQVAITIDQLPHGTIRGLIRGFDGAPIAATIRVDPDAIDVAADADGVFELDVAPGPHQVGIEAPGFVGQKRTVNVTLDGVILLNADLRKAP